jgi:hypothetical protein
MAATPFKISMIAMLPGGQTKMFPLTCTDVANAFALFPSGGDEVVLNGQSDVFITDMILSAAGVDTTQLELYVNGMAQGTIILDATSIGTIVGRPLQSAPVRIPAGATIKWKQLA